MPGSPTILVAKAGIASTISVCSKNKAGVGPTSLHGSAVCWGSGGSGRDDMRSRSGWARASSSRERQMKQLKSADPWCEPDIWYPAAHCRDCFAALAMTVQTIVIARSGATKQSRGARRGIICLVPTTRRSGSSQPRVRSITSSTSGVITSLLSSTQRDATQAGSWFQPTDLKCGLGLSAKKRPAADLEESRCVHRFRAHPFAASGNKTQ